MGRKNILFTIILGFLSVGCSDTEHYELTIQKEAEVTVTDLDGLEQEIYEKDGSWIRRIYYDENATYVNLHYTVDTRINIGFDIVLDCGARARNIYYNSSYIPENNISLEYGAFAPFTKQSLTDHNCLQESGQLQDLNATIDGYGEYSPDKITTTTVTISSNTITYTAQEINEAFAVFESQ